MTSDQHEVLQALSELTQDRDPVQDYIHLLKALDKARTDTLSGLGYTEETRRDLAEAAMAEIRGLRTDVVRLDDGYGLQIIPDKPVRMTRLRHDDRPPWKERLKLIKPKETR